MTPPPVRIYIDSAFVRKTPNQNDISRTEEAKDYMDYAIQTRAIARSFGDVKAVDGIDLYIAKGEIY